MKKLIGCLLLFAGTIAIHSSVNAQAPARNVKTFSDVSLNVDTVIAPVVNISSNVTGIQGTVARLTGSVAGYVLLQGSIDGNYVDISTDTLMVTNKAINTKLWPISRTNYYSYRLWYKSTASTQTSTLTLSTMRRPDEKQ